MMEIDDVNFNALCIQEGEGVVPHFWGHFCRTKTKRDNKNGLACVDMVDRLS